MATGRLRSRRASARSYLSAGRFLHRRRPRRGRRARAASARHELPGDLDLVSARWPHPQLRARLALDTGKRLEAVRLDPESPLRLLEPGLARAKIVELIRQPNLLHAQSDNTERERHEKTGAEPCPGHGFEPAPISVAMEAGYRLALSQGVSGPKRTGAGR